jgi:hypothetical protein
MQFARSGSNDPSRPAGAAGFLRAYLALALLLAVAALQMFLVEATSLTRWKGGGFGMYSEPHFLSRQIWFGHRTPGGLIFEPAPEQRAMLAPILSCKRWPAIGCLAHLVEIAELPGLEVVQVWSPRVDPRTLAYTRTLLAEYRVP